MLVVAALAVALCWPLARVHWFDSHERTDYVLRTVEYAASLRSGTLYPRWCPDFYGGYGSPFFNFYAPLVYWLGAVLTPLAGSPVVALKCVVIIGSVLAGVGVFLLVMLETHREDAAFVAASLYLCSAYRLADVSWRGDLAEYFALSLLPLVLFGYRRIVREPDPTRLPRLAFLAAVTHAALVFTHTVLGLWGTGLVAVVIAFSSVALFRQQAFWRAALLPAACLAALLISALYTLPALAERAHVRTELMTVGGGHPTNNWLLPAELWKDGPFQIGPLLAVAAGLFVIACVVSLRVSRPALPWLLGALAFCALTLPHTAALWRADIIPFGRFIQFPWRLLGPASLCAAIACGLAWAVAFRRRVPVEGAALLLSALAVATAVPLTKVDPWNDKLELEASTIRRQVRSGTGLDEYLPRVVTAPPKSPATELVSTHENLSVEVVSSAGTEHRLRVVAAKAGSLALRLHAFPGWRVQTAEGPTPVALATSRNGLVELRFAKPGRYALSVEFGSTPVRTLALLLSCLGFFGIWPLARSLIRVPLESRTRSAQEAWTPQGVNA